MIKNRNSRTAAIVTAAQLLLLCTLGINARAQTAAPNPTPTVISETAAQGTEQTSSGQLEQVTVTGYLIPRVGEGPQPVATLNQDFIQKQAYQTINDVLNNYPGGLSAQNTQTFAGNSNSPRFIRVHLERTAGWFNAGSCRRVPDAVLCDFDQCRDRSIR